VWVFGRLDPERARDLRDRRERYERRARSIRHGSVRAGSFRHALQAVYRAASDLRRPGRLLLALTAAGSACIAAAGLGAGGTGQCLATIGALPAVLVVVAAVTYAEETLSARGRPEPQRVISPPARPSRRAPQGS
jgi:hypothetical protein